MLFIFAGLPGVGKTTLSREVARLSRAVYLRIDTIESALASSTLAIRSAEDAGYVAAYGLAEDNLRNGLDVVADSVNPIALTRDAWLSVAERAGCAATQIEVICSDVEEHRRRVEGRVAADGAGRQPSWDDVLAREYHPWSRERVVIDTAGKTVAESLAELRASLGGVAPACQELGK